MRPRSNVAAHMHRFPRTVGVDQPLSTARRLLRESGLGYLPVLDAGRLVGVISEGEIAGAELLSLEDAPNTRVDRVMSRDLLVVAPTTSLVEAARLLAQRPAGCVVVVDEGAVVGLLVATDALRALLNQRGVQTGVA